MAWSLDLYRDLLSEQTRTGLPEMLRQDTLSHSVSCTRPPDTVDSESWKTKIRVVQVSQLYSRSWAGVPMGIGVSLIVAAALWEHVPQSLVMGWISIFLATQALRLLSFRFFQKVEASSDQQSILAYGKWFLLGSTVSALLWGCGAAILFPFGTTTDQFLLLAMVAGVGGSLAWAHAPMKECCISSVVLTVAPICVCLLAQGQMTSMALGVTCFVYMFALLATGRAARSMLTESIRLGLEKDRLLEEIERSHLELEQTVAQRTAELSARNEELRKEIADRTAVQEALRSSEEQLSKAQHIASVGSWGLDLENREVTWSAEMFRILEADPETCEPSLANVLDRVHPDDTALVLLLKEESLELGVPHSTEFRLVMPDGRVKCVQSRCEFSLNELGRPIRAVGTIQDVTELRTAEASLFLTQFALDHVTEATYLFDEHVRFQYVNESACRILGYTKEELIGRSLAEVDPDYLLDGWRLDWAQLAEKKAVTLEGVHLTRDGRKFPVEINANYFEYRGIPYYWAFARDITDRKRAQEESLAWERRESESQKLESLGVLAGGIAHDFNNLLTAVLGNIELALADSSISSDARSRLKRAVAASQRAVAVTRQMLAYSGKGKFVLVNVSLSQLVQEDWQLLRAAVGPKVQLALDLDPDAPPIEGDPTQIRQLIVNLLTNASEAVDESRNRICVCTGVSECDEAALGRSRLEDKPKPGVFSYVEVSDSGYGMDEKTLQRLFDPFFSTKFMGRGLGMSAVLGIVRGHGGAILVDSTPGEGTTVQVLFPIANHTREESAQDKFTGGVCHEKEPLLQILGTVLIIDDEEIVRDVCKEMLEHCGFRVLCAANGFDGMRVFRQYARDIDCVILDLSLPSKDGLAALGEIRETRSDVKVILSSWFNSEEAAQRFAVYRFAGFLQKPYHMQTLITRVNEILGCVTV